MHAAHRYEVTCPICNKVMRHAGAFLRHKVSCMKKHTKKIDAVEKGIRCKKCSKTFSDKDSLTKHQLEECSERFRCEICDLTYNSQTSLKRHNNKEHPPEKKCPGCGKVFQSNSKLMAHLKCCKKNTSKKESPSPSLRQRKRAI